MVKRGSLLNDGKCQERRERHEIKNKVTIKHDESDIENAIRSRSLARQELSQLLPWDSCLSEIDRSFGRHVGMETQLDKFK
jgi:hypothetical protein